MFGETIIRVRTTPGSRDEHGNEVSGSSFEVELDEFAIGNAQSADDVSTVGTRVITGYTLYRRSPVDIKTTDTLTIRGVPGWKVDGEVFDWVTPYTNQHRGVQFSAKRGS